MMVTLLCAGVTFSAMCLYTGFYLSIPPLDPFGMFSCLMLRSSASGRIAVAFGICLGRRHRGGLPSPSRALGWYQGAWERKIIRIGDGCRRLPERQHDQGAWERGGRLKHRIWEHCRRRRRRRVSDGNGLGENMPAKVALRSVVGASSTASRRVAVACSGAVLALGFHLGEKG